MEKFNIQDYWEQRFAIHRDKFAGDGAGIGSAGEEAQYKAEILNKLIKELGIKSIMDYGCATGNNLKLYQGFDTYCGYDISKTAINRCKEIFTDDKYSFTDDINSINTNADMALSMDVIFHQVNDDDYYDYLHLLFNDKHKYVIIYATNHERNLGVAPHVKHRCFTNDLESLICFSNYRLHSWYKGYHEDEGKIMAVYEHY